MPTLTPRPYAVAKAAVDRFNDVRTGIADLPVSSEQTKWVWFSQHELERILFILSRNFPNHNNLQRGIKFYLGMYPNEDDSGHNDGHKYTDKLCLVMAPSRVVKNAAGQEVLMDYGKNDEGHIFPDIQTHTVFKESPYDNVGSLCPPRCQIMSEGDVF